MKVCPSCDAHREFINVAIERHYCKVDENGNYICDLGVWERVGMDRSIWFCYECGREAVEPKDCFMVVVYDEHKRIKETMDFARYKDADMYCRKHGGYVVGPLCFYEKMGKPLTDKDIEKIDELNQILDEQAKAMNLDAFDILAGKLELNGEYLDKYEEIKYGDYYWKRRGGK